MNTVLWLCLLAVNFIFILFCFRKWGKTGLFIWIPVSCIIANIQVTKNVVLFGLEATLGNIVYATSFLATDILNEFYGKKEADRAVWFGFFSLIAMTVLMQLAILFQPSASDVVQSGLQSVFGFMPRIAVASLAAYLLSNMHDVRAYEFWHRKTGDKHLWLRNNASTFVSQLIDTVVFTLGAFLGVYESSVLWQIMISTYLLKWIVALADTAVIYIAKSWVGKGLIPDADKS